MANSIMKKHFYTMYSFMLMLVWVYGLFFIKLLLSKRAERILDLHTRRCCRASSIYKNKYMITTALTASVIGSFPIWYFLF